MNEDYRPIEVVDVGSGPPRPARAPRTGNRTELLLMLLVVGVFLSTGAFAYGAWIEREGQRDNRMLNCMYVGMTAGDNNTSYDELPKPERKLVDRFDCDVPGR